jgi:hypothetical protein
MKYLQFVNENLTDTVYHFTYLSKLYNILKTNKLYLTPVFGTEVDNEINDGKLYALSLTSSSKNHSFHIIVKIDETQM